MCAKIRSADDAPDDEEESGNEWHAGSVLNILILMVQKSQIQEQLKIYASGGNPNDDAEIDEFGRHPMYKMFGYFSLMGLLRLHCLLGDYSEALRVLGHVELGKKHLFTYGGVPACQV